MKNCFTEYGSNHIEGGEKSSSLNLFYETLRDCAREMRSRIGTSFVFSHIKEEFFAEAGTYGIRMDLKEDSVKYTPLGDAQQLCDFIVPETDREVSSISSNLRILEAPLIDMKEEAA